jgi:hypothetical protein
MMNINPENIIGDIKGVIIVTAALLLIGLICKLISTMSEKARKTGGGASRISETPAEAPDNEPSRGGVKLIDVDERTAAIIMAIVSDDSGIPLSELNFKSIKLVN